jgi:hypothetical protein
MPCSVVYEISFYAQKAAYAKGRKSEIKLRSCGLPT